MLYGNGNMGHVLDCYNYTVSQCFVPYLLIPILALDLEGVHDVKLHHPSSSVATSNQ